MGCASGSNGGGVGGLAKIEGGFATSTCLAFSAGNHLLCVFGSAVGGLGSPMTAAVYPLDMGRSDGSDGLSRWRVLFPLHEAYSPGAGVVYVRGAGTVGPYLYFIQAFLYCVYVHCVWVTCMLALALAIGAFQLNFFL